MSNPSPCALVWFREDFRLEDNPALAAAAASGLPLLCVFILEDEGLRPIGGAARWRLDRALQAFEGDLARFGGRLHFLRGAAESLLPQLAQAAGAQKLFFNRRYGGAERAIDARVAAAFAGRVESFNGALLAEPAQLSPRPGGHYKVFTPFWRAIRDKLAHAEPHPAPDHLAFTEWPPDFPQLDRAALALSPSRPDWARDFPEPHAGPDGAERRLRHFIDEKLDGYETMRDRIDCDGASKLSANLHFGEISPRQIVAAVRGRPAEKFLIELCWREFSTHLLYARPDLPWENFNARFDRFPYRNDPHGLDAWKGGRTGYPVVDAAMRQVWRTGFMANRARMIAASFLVKHLLIDWREGESWFWDTLTDADAANNAVSWQWVAGSGPDAAPYFRIFNPVLQGEKFDPDGDFVRSWCPELAGLPAKWIHRPFAAPRDILEAAGVKIGGNWPAPIVEHDFARRRALDAFAATAAAGA
ncbi:deoxyribodipyrimidine photo-lyase [Rhodoblastus acidophilus]|uniref:cryptochrome/photolyase family protein n=1 Tax=Rhodoblastus acidophilus TaxID=1074 RepID=UPI00222488CB|nr:deoxyribodipyrimidine photo-lyase [Rhodoblastus acidophilus]MCW2285064.1 deoxyribodipyrimidine photo-lyase [Rhodoblastus acidophilus]MCW2334078.1 deoxyribodipyrimidine photo-lyase [Rhodoblastus acidophilus]